MYAIVCINGQQFKVEEGKKLFVHHIQNAEAGHPPLNMAENMLCIL